MVVNKEHSLGFWCARVGQQYLTMLHDRLAHLGLERGYFALVLIVETEGKVSQQELADALHMDKVAMARTIDHLCEHGYVQRAACPNDRRKHHIKLMPKAIPAVKEIKQAFTTLDRMALKDLDGAGRGQMIQQLREALGNLHQVSAAVAEKPKKQPTH